MTRKPEYRVAAMSKKTDIKGNVGAAWFNPDGSIAIVLDAFVVLHGGKDTLITLFPTKEGKEAQQ